MQFSPSKVGYASHQLSLWHGKCPNGCLYCYVEKLYGGKGQKYAWATGEYRRNPKALELATHAAKKGVMQLVVSFTSDPLPQFPSEKDNNYNFDYLVEVLTILQDRQIPTKVLTKNAAIADLVNYLQPSPELQIGCSITTNWYNESAQRQWEGNCPSTIADRLIALSKLRDYGFRTWASCEPILPDTNIGKLLNDLKGAGIQETWFGNGNYYPALNWCDWSLVKQQIQDYPYCQSLNIHFKGALA